MKHLIGVPTKHCVVSMWDVIRVALRLSLPTNNCSVVQRKAARTEGGGKKRVSEMFFFVWWMSCSHKGWALPLQINQTWHCPVLEHLGRPRDRIKGLVSPWTLSVPNMHSELMNSYPVHFSHHHPYWLFVSHQQFLSSILDHIPRGFFLLLLFIMVTVAGQGGRWTAGSGAAGQHGKSIHELINLH